MKIITSLTASLKKIPSFYDGTRNATRVPRKIHHLMGEILITTSHNTVHIGTINNANVITPKV